MPEFAVRDIRPNPFRHLERYAINRQKVDTLRESMRTTGFWDNIVCRLVDGKPEQAYGHHRTVAVTEEFGPNHKVGVIVRELDDEHMLQIMARENMEEWGTSAAIEHETVRAVVEAYAEGKIELAQPAQGARQVRYAPSFSLSPEKSPRGGDFPYSVTSVAAFLGWVDPSGKPQDKVGYALGALELIEEGVLSDSDFDGLSTKDAEAVVKETRKARAADLAAADLARREAEEAAERAERAEQQRVEAAERERAARAARDQAAEEEAARARRAATEEKKQATAQVRQRTQKVSTHTERASTRASTAGKAVSTGIKSGEGYRRAGDLAAAAVPRERGPLPNIGPFTRRLAADIGRILDHDDPRLDRLSELVKSREYIPLGERNNLVLTLRQLAVKIEAFADQLDGHTAVGTSRKALPRGGR